MRTRSVSVATLVCALAVSLTGAQTVTQITNQLDEDSGPIAIDDAGTAAFARSSSDPTGTNPDHEIQLVRWDLPSGLRSELTSFGGVGQFGSVSDDGQKLVFTSIADPLGQNGDGSLELFLLSAGGAVESQLTDQPMNGGRIFTPVISGSGDRVVFVAEFDPLGANPALRQQLFAIDADGTDLVQLTTLTNDEQVTCLDISDDGNRVVFGLEPSLPGVNGQVYRVESSGAGLTQLTSSSQDSVSCTLAGNGQLVAYVERIAGDDTVLVMPWSGGSPFSVAEGTSPSLSDDAKWAYFSRYDGNNIDIYKASTQGGAATALTATTSPIANQTPSVSGANDRVAYLAGPFGQPQVRVMDNDGSNDVALTSDVKVPVVWEPDVTADGSRVVYTVGDSFDSDIHRVQSDGTDPFAITVGAQAYHPAVTADGQTVVFVSWEDLVGENTCGGGQIYSVHADGTGIDQLSSCSTCFLSDHPALARGGSKVVFQCNGPILKAVDLATGVETEVLDDGNSLRKNPRIDNAGEWVVYHSQSTLFGSNPDGSTQVFRARTDGTFVEQISPTSSHGSFSPDISGSGNLIVYTSTADPVGINADHSSEIFSYEPATGTTTQLTFAATGSSGEPRISGDGLYVFFTSTSPLMEPAAWERRDLYRVTLATGEIDRAGGLPDPRREVLSSGLTNNPYHSVDGNGRAILAAGLDATDQNPDGSFELWRIDFSSAATLEIGKGAAPTELRWSPDPRAVRYDVVRGDVADLQAFGGDIDLGAVACVADDLPAADTLGAGDNAQPASGQVFFYLYRWSDTTTGAMGTWGHGSSGEERIDSTAACGS